MNPVYVPGQEVWAWHNWKITCAAIIGRTEGSDTRYDILDQNYGTFSVLGSFLYPTRQEAEDAMRAELEHCIAVEKRAMNSDTLIIKDKQKSIQEHKDNIQFYNKILTKHNKETKHESTKRRQRKVH